MWSVNRATTSLTSTKGGAARIRTARYALAALDELHYTHYGQRAGRMSLTQKAKPRCSGPLAPTGGGTHPAKHWHAKRYPRTYAHYAGHIPRRVFVTSLPSCGSGSTHPPRACRPPISCLIAAGASHRKRTRAGRTGTSASAFGRSSTAATKIDRSAYGDHSAEPELIAAPAKSSPHRTRTRAPALPSSRQHCSARQHACADCDQGQ